MRVRSVPSSLALSACLLQPAAPGQTVPPAQHARAPHPTKAATPRPNPLRVTEVSLYKNGVGFFQHTARVTGDESLNLDLSSAQLDDVLQTLTAVDLGGGHITGANYNSTTPLEQQLRNLPLSLGADPTEADLYSALRGARVEVTGSGAAFTGRILTLEERPTPVVDGNVKPAPDRRVLTVIADSGATRTLDMTPNTTVRLLDDALRTDLNTYLHLLDSSRTEGIRHLTLTDRGTGARELRVSFLSEVPVWKSTYRLLLTHVAASGAGPEGAGRATMQGFSVIDNTTGEDWNGVQLSLIAGSPQSFLQPLSQPIYDRRPEVPVAANAQLTPQTHDAANSPAPPPGSASAELNSGPGGGPASLFGSPSGVDSGSPSAFAKRNFIMMKDSGPPPPPLAPIPYEARARETVAPRATASAFDDFFAYKLSDPVTIPRNGSALVPILQVQLPVESVTLWSASDPTPLRALWLTNSSQLTMDRGSFSVVEDGAFAGQGLLDPIHPGERRLLSYAADQAVRVTPEHADVTQRVTSLSVTKGVLHATNAEVADVEYEVSNAAPGPRTVVIEEARRPGWTLDTEAKPTETTPAAYRFRLDAPAGGTAHLKVRQEHTLDQYFQLVDAREEQMEIYLRNNHASASFLAQLEPVFAAKRTLAGLNLRISEEQTRSNGIVEDQKRLRDNLAALKGTAEERTLARRYTEELNAQEDTLAKLRKDVAALGEQRAAAQADLSQKIESLQIAEGS